MGGDAGKSSPLMRMPVPWVFVIAYLLGIGIKTVVPVSMGSASWLLLAQILGIVMLAAGATLAVWARLIFHREHTTTVPFETTTSMVTWGPYRLSRNPMYLGLFLFFGGISVALAFFWSVLFLVIVVYYVNSRVIPLEERQLRRNFPEVYERYCVDVRRWV
jgi:protein-S-isoprenylcysteine O-methyltransferase Ste14